MKTKPTIFTALALGLSATGAFAQTIEVTSTGVGIGTSTPANTLDVKSTGSSTVIGLKTSGQAADAFRLLDSDGSLLLSNGITSNLLSLVGTKVGIGTATPAFKLSVVGDIQIASSGGSLRFSPSSGGMGIEDDSGSLILYNGSGSDTRVTVTSSGNVGIGTTSPSYLLHVAGSVRATSFISNSTTYADFVFAPDYKLTPLAELESTVKAQRHLPGIPDEAEAKAHGVDLAAMQVKLLQKVEELTLYLVEHDKALHQLQAENEALRRKVAALEKP